MAAHGWLHIAAHGWLHMAAHGWLHIAAHGWLHMAAHGWLHMAAHGWLHMAAHPWLRFPDHGGSISVTSYSGPALADKALLDAASAGDARAVESAFAQGARVDARGEHSFTALHLASRRGAVDVMSVLIAAGA